MVEEKDIIYSQVSHWIKNNLQIVLNLLDVEARRTKDKQVLEVFRRCRGRINSIALLHEKLYRVEGEGTVSFSEYVQGVVAALFASYGVDADKVKVEIDVDKGAEGFVGLRDGGSVSRAISCGLIINELVSNSLKHAFGDDSGGQIGIKFSLGDGRYLLVVSDDGVGLPKDFELENKRSVGLRLVSRLVGQLGGQVEVDGSSGTAFKITFSA